MSASKGSMATAKKPAAKPVVKEGDKVKEKKKIVALKGRVRSGKYAPKSRTSLYINAKAEKLAKKEAKKAAKTPKVSKKLIHGKQIRRTMWNMYQKRVKLAKKEGKPLPAPFPYSRVEKRVNMLVERRAKRKEEKVAGRKLRVQKAEAYMKLFGPNYRAAKKAYKGRWPKAALEARRAVVAARAAVPRPKKTIKPRKTTHAWRPTVRPWCSGQRTHWAAAIKASTRKEKQKGVKHNKDFGSLLKRIAKGQTLPKTRFERKEEALIRMAANTRKQREASKAFKAANPDKVRKLSPLEEKRAAKKQKRDEKKKEKRTARNAKRDALKKKVEAAGKKYKPMKKPPANRKASFRKFKKISVFNLDKMRTNHVKWWANNRVKLRSNIKPGSVVIILKGKFAGRRAVFLRQLPRSRDLLVTGPFKVNGVPLYRIAQNFVIGTSTRISVKKVPGLKGRLLTDRLFYIRRKKSKKAKTSTKAAQTPEEFFKKDKPKKRPYNLHRTKIQARTDKALMPIIKKITGMKEYLQTTFSLSDKDAPHRMRF